MNESVEVSNNGFATGQIIISNRDKNHDLVLQDDRVSTILKSISISHVTELLLPDVDVRNDSARYATDVYKESLLKQRNFSVLTDVHLSIMRLGLNNRQTNISLQDYDVDGNASKTSIMIGAKNWRVLSIMRLDRRKHVFQHFLR